MFVRDHDEEQGPVCRRSGEQVLAVIPDVLQFLFFVLHSATIQPSVNTKSIMEKVRAEP